jgi:HlyD family secretion protein
MAQAVLALGFILGGCGKLPGSSGAAATPTPTPSAAQSQAIATLGRLQPEGEVIRVSVPNAQDSRVNQLLVKEGDRVEANQVIAILQGVNRRKADLEGAEALRQLRLAELKKARQGDTKPSGLVAQDAVVERLERQLKTQRQQKRAAIVQAEAVLREAELTAQRRQTLVDQGAIAEAELNLAQRNLATAQATLAEKQADLAESEATLEAQIQEAEARLQELQEVRPVDVEIAEAQLDQAEVSVNQRQADLDDVQVRAPIRGQILRINTRVGEQVNVAQGIVELARTDAMYAVAEVAEVDIGQVKPGQSATITTDYRGFKGEVQGSVVQVGLQVGKRSLQDEKANTALADSNARIVEVKIRINPGDNDKVRAFTGMQIRVRINTG